MFADLPLFALALGGGAISFFSPCVLPLVPAYLSYASGQTLGELREGRERSALMLHLSAFVLGFAFVFILLGASASILFPYLLQWRSELNWLAGGIVILFGAQLAGLIQLGWLMRQWQWSPAVQQSGAFSCFCAGVSFAFGWTPCMARFSPAFWGWRGSATACGRIRGWHLCARLGLPFLATAGEGGAGSRPPLAAAATWWCAERRHFDSQRRAYRHQPIAAHRVCAAQLVSRTGAAGLGGEAGFAYHRPRLKQRKRRAPILQRKMRMHMRAHVGARHQRIHRRDIFCASLRVAAAIFASPHADDRIALDERIVHRQTGNPPGGKAYHQIAPAPANGARAQSNWSPPTGS